MKKAPQKLLFRALLLDCTNIAIPHRAQCVRSNFRKGAGQKFFAELFFKKATSRARRRPPYNYLMEVMPWNDRDCWVGERGT